MVTIVNRQGLHARPITRFVETARRYDASIRVRAPHAEPADGRSVFSLMTLACGVGTQLELEADGPQAGEALAALVALVSAGFGES